MKALLSTPILLLISLSLLGQQKSRFFKFPSKIKASDYSHDFVVVKLKAENSNIFKSTNKAGRATQSIPPSVSAAGGLSANKLISEKLLSQGRVAKGPVVNKSNIDMNLYFEIRCKRGKNIEDFINDLHATGFFELVEPSYVDKMFFTPNDPSLSSQYFLKNIKAYEAWDITQGSESVIIAIVDSGGDLDHPDLIDNIYSNPLDPIDGIDNDNNGFIDDNRGWDFMGADTLNINDPQFAGDNNPNLTKAGIIAHGANVAGCAGARANNGIGGAGVGFKSKLLITKHSADNQKANSLSIYRGYDGILYAASMGAKVINCSWGGSFRSQIAQDIVNYVTNLGSLVVAAAGNENTREPGYPASYDNVLSVAAVDKNNVRASFSNYGSTVDISAPGVGIYTTAFDNTYTTTQGTSFSSPIVAGAAALVAAKFPSYTPQQIAEQLRVTSNSSLLYASNAGFANSLGKGLLDVYQALTASSPALRASSPKLLNSNGLIAEPGQKAFLSFLFKNLLKPTSSGLSINISSTSPFIQITKASISPGAIGENSSISNKLSPFEIQIANSVPENTVVTLAISYLDGNYSDREEVNFILNPSFIDIEENLITTTLSSKGRMGFEDTEASTRLKGNGFVFDDNSLIYEMGLIMGTSTNFLFNSVRGASTTFDNDFVSTTKIKAILPGERSNTEVFGTLSNSASPASQSFLLDYRSLVWKGAPYDKFVIIEYKIKNPTSQPISNFHFGIFADWDITESGAQDAAKWDNTNKMGYVYPAQTAAKPHAGIQVLTGSAEYFAIDNDQKIAGNPFGLYDGFTDAEKIQSISSGLGRIEAGVSTSQGNDVSHVVSSGPYNIGAGEEIRIAFALLAASNFSELQTSARYADSVYNFTLNQTKPVVPDVNVCFGSAATIDATGAPSYKWYKNFTGGTSFYSGSQYTTTNLFNDTTFYISNAEQSYESVRTPAKVSIKANPTITTSGNPVFCDGNSIILSVADADSYLWSNGANGKTISVNSAGTYSVSVTSNSPLCQSSSSPLLVTVKPNPLSKFAITNGGELKVLTPISFTDQSTGATSWAWDFGDGQKSDLPNPTNTYKSIKDFNVSLTVTSANGCQNLSAQKISIITALEDIIENTFSIYPNPTSGSKLMIKFNTLDDSPVQVQFLSSRGDVHQTLTAQPISKSVEQEFSVGDWANGLYIVKVEVGGSIVTKKFIKTQ
jgi:serine protease